MIRRLLAALALVMIGGAAILATGVWLIVRDDVHRLRSSAARATTPLPPMLANAIVAVEDPLIRQPQRVSWRAFVPRRGVVKCAPTLAYKLVARRSVAKREISAYAVSCAFTPDELLRIYANEVYLGRVDGRMIIGIDAASDAYFGKPSRDLTLTEAATIVAMIHTRKDAHRRRNFVLESMRRRGYIDARQYTEAIAEPVLRRRS